MKMAVKVQEVEGEGLLGLLGQKVTLYGLNFIYTGTLVGVNDTCVKLTNAAIVYDTGAHTTPTYLDVQALPHDWYVNLSAIESFGIFK